MNIGDWLERLLVEVPQVSQAIHVPSLESTNTEAMRLGKKGAHHGTLIFADEQTGGRGRLGRHWDSPAGKGLYFSLLLRPSLPPAQAPLLTLAVGLALGKALREIGVSRLLIKWPNDLWVEGKKLGGILTEMFNQGEKLDFVVVGIGINLSTQAQDLSPEVAGLATSLMQILKKDVARDEILSRILPEIFQETERLVREGPSQLISRWVKDSGMVGKRVRASENGKTWEGTVSGLAADGQLQIRTDAGDLTSIIAGDIALCS